MQTIGNGRKFHSFLMVFCFSTFSYFQQTNNSLLSNSFTLDVKLAIRTKFEITPLNKPNHAYFKYFPKVLFLCVLFFFCSCRSRRHSENYRFSHFFILSISAFCAKSVVGGCCCLVYSMLYSMCVDGEANLEKKLYPNKKN